MSDTANIDSTAPRKMPSDTGQSGASTSAAPRDVYDAGLAQATQDETR